MAVLAQNQQLTLIEATKAQGYDDFSKVIGELGRVNDFLDEVPWLPTTHGSYNKAFQARSLGKGAFSKTNGAVSVIASAGDEAVEPVKLYEGDSQVDERVLKGVQDPYKVRDSQDAMNLEGMTQDWLYNLIYSTPGANPDAFKGLMARRPSLGKTCIGFGGTASGALSSGYLFEFGPSGFYLGYPEGSGTPGFNNDDRGRWYVPAPSGGGNMWAWVRHYEIWGAIIQRDERAMIRLANLNPAGGTGDFTSAPFLKAKRTLPSQGRNAVAFFTRNVAARLDEYAFSKANVFYTVGEIANYGPVTRIGGIPVRVMEALLETEATVS